MLGWGVLDDGVMVRGINLCVALRCVGVEVGGSNRDRYT